jgi:hypothetical protein
MTLTIEAVGLRKRLSKTTPWTGSAWPCSARPRTNDLGSTQDVHAPPAGRAPHAGM